MHFRKSICALSSSFSLSLSLLLLVGLPVGQSAAINQALFFLVL
jgi:hypothetical protein